jgi:lipoyl-dependent peroxiredoxin
MSEKTASVLWTGSGKQGKGQISTQSGALMDYPYGFASRFADDHRGSNPEELLGAAHAACFSMAFSLACEKAGWATRTVDTQAHVRLTAQGPEFVIDRILLKMKASVPGLDEAQFQQIAASAKRDCPLSKALASVAEIALEATLNTTEPAVAASAQAPAQRPAGQAAAA